MRTNYILVLNNLFLKNDIKHLSMKKKYQEDECAYRFEFAFEVVPQVKKPGSTRHTNYRLSHSLLQREFFSYHRKIK